MKTGAVTEANTRNNDYFFLNLLGTGTKKPFPAKSAEVKEQDYLA